MMYPFKNKNSILILKTPRHDLYSEDNFGGKNTFVLNNYFIR